MQFRRLSIFLVLFAISACTTINDVGSDIPTILVPSSTIEADFSTPDLPTRESEKDSSHMTLAPLSSGLQALIEKAKRELAQRLSIAIMEINLIKAEEVVWSNASLGCPQPGMVYAEVLTPGYLILLEANNKGYEYHADLQDAIMFCNFALEESSSSKDTDKNVEDGWPSQTKDRDVIIVTPTSQK